MPTRTAVGTENFASAGNLGGNWTQINTPWGNVSASGGVCDKVAPNAANIRAVRWNVGTWTADQYAKTTFDAFSGFNAFSEASVTVRSDGSGATQNYYNAYIYSLAATAAGCYSRIEKTVANVNTSLSSVAADGWTVGDTLEIEAEGTTIRLMRNGALIRSVTDSSLAGSSTTSAGISAGGGDNWEGGTLSSGTSFSYTASGGIAFAGAASKTSKRVNTTAGGITFSGAAPASTHTSKLIVAAAGGIAFAGTAAQALKRAVLAAGGITFGGAATVTTHISKLIVTAAGGITFGGAAAVSYVGRIARDFIIRMRRRRL